MKERMFFKSIRALKRRAGIIVEKLQAYRQMALNFRPHARKQHKRLFLGLITGFGYVVAGMLEPWPLKMIFDNVFLEEPLPESISKFFGNLTESHYTTLYLLIGLIVVIAVERGIFFYYQQLLVSKAGQKIASGIRLELYDHLQRLSFSFHDKSKTGDLISRLTTDMRILREILVSLPLTMITDLLSMAAMIAVMAYMDIELTLIALLVIPMLFLLIKKYRLPMKDAMRKQREREGHLTTLASEALGAIKVVQGYHQEEHEVGKFLHENKNTLNSGLKATRLEAKMNWASDLSVAIVMALVLGVAGRRVLMGAITPGELLVFAYYLRSFNRPLRRTSKVMEQLSRATASGERIADLVKVKSEVEEKPGARFAPRFKGDICYKDVWLEYRPGKTVLEDINLKIEAGEKVAIVGHSGSGKSSLVSLLPRFYECTSGSVQIDGADVREWTLESLRTQISIIFQEPVLFSTTIAENIAYGKPGSSKEEIIEASRKANLHPIIEKLSKGYDTVLGERGGTLSGGQRQCVAIARAIIKDAPIIILDEPTSGLDLLSAMLVMQAIKELTKNKTVIIISHQPETIGDVDRVFKMSKKKIVSQTTRKNYLRKKRNREEVKV